MTSDVTICGAILAGGESRRMGSPKEGLMLPDGRCMIEAVVDNLYPCCESIVVVGQCIGYDINRNVKISKKLLDTVPGEGPLGGVLTLLNSEISENYLVLGCDQPFVRSETLKLLINQHSSHFEVTLFKPTNSDDRFNPFPGIYTMSWLAKAKPLFQQGQRSMVSVLQQSRINWVSATEEVRQEFASMNTLLDLSQYLKPLTIEKRI